MSGRTMGAVALLWCLAGMGALHGADAGVLPHAATSSAITVAQFEGSSGSASPAYGIPTLFSMNGNMALTGGTNAAGKPSIFEYDRTNGAWDASPTAVLSSPDTTHTSVFTPLAVSAEGSTLVAGAPVLVFGATQEDWSRVYIYSRSNGAWSQAPVAVLSNPRTGGNDSDGFGEKATLSGDGSTLLLADHATIDGVPDEGAVYLYEKVNGLWETSPEATFLDPDPIIVSGYGATVSATQFGYWSASVSSDGRSVIVGDPATGHPGKAYLYEANADGTWPADPQPVAVLQRPAPSGTVDDGFGSHVGFARDGTEAYVGTSRFDVTPTLYLFKKSSGTWSTDAVRKFVVPDADTSAYSDTRFALSGDGNTLFLATYQSVESQPNCCGFVYVYQRKNGTWSQSPVNRLAEPDQYLSPYNNAFGQSSLVSTTDGSTVLIGDEQPGNVTPPAGGPSYPGPGAAFAFHTTDDWAQPYTGGGTPPPSAGGSPGGGGSQAGGSGGGSLGGLALAALLLLLAVRGYAERGKRRKS